MPTSSLVAGNLFRQRQVTDSCSSAVIVLKIVCRDSIELHPACSAWDYIQFEEITDLFLFPGKLLMCKFMQRVNKCMFLKVIKIFHKACPK